MGSEVRSLASFSTYRSTNSSINPLTVLVVGETLSILEWVFATVDPLAKVARLADGL